MVELFSGRGDGKSRRRQSLLGTSRLALGSRTHCGDVHELAFLDNANQVPTLSLTARTALDDLDRVSLATAIFLVMHMTNGLATQDLAIFRVPHATRDFAATRLVRLGTLDDSDGYFLRPLGLSALND